MGQAANSGRRATLDDKKRRAAGRQQQQGPEARAIREAYSELPARGRTGGAFGRAGQINRRGGVGTRGARGGGGESSPVKDAHLTTPRRKTARKGGI
jgi:hypothetical protein